MKVPPVDLVAQNLPLEKELTAAFMRVLHSGRFILGTEVESFEEEIAAFLGVEPWQTIAVSSGTDALLVALMALDIGPGDEVIVPAFSFFATASCVVRLGATPVFADISPISFNIDPADAAQKVTGKTRAIIPVHLYGQCAEMNAMLDIAEQNGLAVVEDAAQALGATYHDRQAGTMGDFGAYSFYPTKNLSGFGDGGLMYVKTPDKAAKCRALRNQGMTARYQHTYLGGNFRMDALQAALLRVKVDFLEDWILARQSIASSYQKAFGHRDLACFFSCERHDTPAPSDRILIPTACGKNRHSWNQFTVLLPNEGKRNECFKNLREEGIYAEVYYPNLLSDQFSLQCLKSEEVDTPVARNVSQRCLSLPIYPEVQVSAIEHVVNLLKKSHTSARA